jgi:translation initiation factor 6
MRLSRYGGNPNIGVYAVACEETALVATDADPGFLRGLETVLGVKTLQVSVSGSSVVGSLAAMNSNGTVVSGLAAASEVSKIREFTGKEVCLLSGRFNAAGNNVVVNDYGCIANPSLSDKAVSELSDTFGVECVRASVAGIGTVGSVCVVTNKGCICHPDASDEEVELIEDLLKVRPVRTTVNHGVDFLGSGIIANGKGALVGDQTMPLELGRIEDGLNLF